MACLMQNHEMFPFMQRRELADLVFQLFLQLVTLCTVTLNFNFNNLVQLYQYLFNIPHFLNFFFQYIAFLLDRKGEGTHSCYITEAHEGQMNTIDVIHNVVNFGEFMCTACTLFKEQFKIIN